MTEDKDEKARVNPAARHDPPLPPERRAEEERTRDRQVRAAQDTPLNPLDPGGIGQ